MLYQNFSKELREELFKRNAEIVAEYKKLRKTDTMTQKELMYHLSIKYSNKYKHLGKIGHIEWRSIYRYVKLNKIVRLYKTTKE